MRATSVTELLAKEIDFYDFEDEWYEAFDRPERTGVWFIWGASGNGKTSFSLKLAKELCKYDNVLYNSLEEGTGGTMQRAFRRLGMKEVKGKITVVEEDIESLTKRLKKRQSPKIVFIDSIQFARLNEKQYYNFINQFRHNKLLVFISQAKGKDPRGSAAEASMYSATLKIWVEGFRAISKGRYFGPRGYYTIAEEKAAQYWLDTP